MTEATTLDAYGALTDEPMTLRIQRRLPGPIDRVWAYLTDSSLRRQWLASGDMELKVGAPFELVWRNDELTTPSGERPQGMPAENRLATEITAIDAPRRLAFKWFGAGEVTFELEPQGDEVLLTVTHQRISDRVNLLKVSAGWHTHLDILEARARGREPAPVWTTWSRLHAEYDARLPD
jgi:uncharacterized protein YndB with AHSA1/START domain